MKVQIVSEEREGQVKYLTYKGSLALGREEGSYQLVKHKYQERVIKYIDDKSNSMISGISDLENKEENICPS